MLDSANYNSAKVVIAKSVTIMAVPGALGSIVTSGGPAIEIPPRSLGPDGLPAAWSVTLRNLAIRPANTSETSGISMPSAVSMWSAYLTLDNCSIADMRGPAISGAGTLRINASTMRRNTGLPVLSFSGDLAMVNADVRGEVQASGTVVISNSTLEGRLSLEGASAAIRGTTIVGSMSATNDPGRSTKVSMVQSTLSGQFFVGALSAGPSLAVSVHQSQIIDSSSFGLFIESRGGGAVFVFVTDSLVANKTLAAISAQSFSGGPSKVFVSSSTITDSEVAFMNAGFIFESAGNNALRGNAQDVYGAVTVVPLK